MAALTRRTTGAGDRPAGPIRRIRAAVWSPFAFLFVRSRPETYLAEYVLREHKRGRTLGEVLDDPYVRNCFTAMQIRRLLERPDIVRMIGADDVAAVRAALTYERR